LIMPFDRTPANLVLRALDYTPVGALRSLNALRHVDQIRNGENSRLSKELDRQIETLEKETQKRAKMIESLDKDKIHSIF